MEPNDAITQCNWKTVIERQAAYQKELKATKKKPDRLRDRNSYASKYDKEQRW